MTIIRIHPHTHANTHTQAQELLSGNATGLPAGKKLRDLRVIALPAASSHVYREREPNVDDPNSAIQVYFQVGTDDLKTRMCGELFANIVREPIFNQLRTTEQLGGYTL